MTNNPLLNPDLFVGLPFALPATVEAADWLHELDFVDAQAGGLGELLDLAERAPTPDAAEWLRSMVAARAH